MATGLLNHSASCINQNNNEVGIAGTGNHITGVLYMPRCIGNNKLAIWRTKIFIGHINGNALLTFCT